MSPKNPRNNPPRSAPTAVPPPSAFENPAAFNRDVQARRLTENHAEMAEARMVSDPRFADMQNSPLNVPRSDMPQGFALPPLPVVGSKVAPEYPTGHAYVGPPGAFTSESEMSQEEVDAEREEALRQAGIIDSNQSSAPMPPPQSAVPPQQVRQQQPRPQQSPRKEVPPPAKKPVHTSDVHPILKQLRFDLGLDTQKTIDLTIADHVWGFYPLTPELTTLALRIADMGSSANTERELLQQYAAVCCSIVSIDGVPLWQVFGIMPEREDDVSHPFSPKGRIRQKAALALLQELMTNSKLGVIHALLQGYNAEVDPMGSVKGYTEYRNEQYYRYSCPVEFCTHKIVRSKRFNQSNEEMPYFCEIHGDQLVVDDPNGIGSMKGGLNPLG